MPRPPYNASRDQRYFNVAGAEPQIPCAIKTCPERAWERDDWGRCAACKLPTCPSCLQSVDGEEFCASCAEAQVCEVCDLADQGIGEPCGCRIPAQRKGEMAREADAMVKGLIA